MTKNLDKTLNRDTPSQGEPGEPTIVPSQRHFAPAPPEACARHCTQQSLIRDQRLKALAGNCWSEASLSLNTSDQM